MATDATGTPTSPDSLPTYNTATDKPSGNGFNAAMAQIQAALNLRALAANPAFTGTPTAPTAAVDTDTTQIATTAFVINQLYLKAATAVATYAPLASPAFTGVPTAPTAAVDTNTTQLATTAYVIGQAYAKLASPTFTGTPSLPTGTTGVTQATADNSTKLATTAFVKAQGYLTSSGAVASFNGRTGAVVPASGDYTAAEVTNAADKSSTTAQAFSANVNAAAHAVSLANGAAYTPDASRYQTHVITWTAGPSAPNVGNPTGGVAGTILTFVIHNSAASGAVFMNTVLQGTLYKGMDNSTSFTNGQSATQSFVFDGTYWYSLGTVVPI